MTDLRKQVKRKTISSCYSGRRLVVMLMPGDVLGIKEERCRKVFTAPLGRIYTVLVKWNVDAERAEKRAAKKKRKL